MNGRIGHILRKGGFAIALSALLAGCSDGDGLSESGGNAIGFRAAVETTRATETTVNNIRTFRVSAVWKKQNGNYDPTFMEKQIVEKEDSEWVYSPVRYMPTQGSVDFFAYSPAISSGVKSFTVPASAYEQPEIGYKVVTDPSKQEDFMAAAALGQTSSPIRLDFAHMLSSVEFMVRSVIDGVSYRVREITLNDLRTEDTLVGTISGSPEKIVWSWAENPSPTDNYTIHQTAPIDVGQKFIPFNDGIGPLMILPQTVGDDNDARISVLFEIPDQPETQYTYTVLLRDIYDSDFVFAPSTKYTFSVSLDTATRTVTGQTASGVKIHVSSRKM